MRTVRHSRKTVRYCTRKTWNSRPFGASRYVTKHAFHIIWRHLKLSVWKPAHLSVQLEDVSRNNRLTADTHTHTASPKTPLIGSRQVELCLCVQFCACSCLSIRIRTKKKTKKKQKDGEDGGSESANSFFSSIFPISLSVSLRLTGLVFLGPAVCLTSRHNLEKKGIEER